MIDEYKKSLIIPQVKEHMMEEDWDKIDEMFTEVYFTTFDGIPRYTLKPPFDNYDVAMQFSAVNGAYIEITSWEYIKEIGVLV